MSKIYQKMEINRDRIIDLAQNLIRIPSYTFHESNLAYFLFSYFKGAGFDVELQTVPLPNGDQSHQVVARLKGRKGGPKGLLCGHMDILEIFRPDQWTFDPFCGDVVNGWLRGQGSLNMKAGLAAIIGAVDCIKNSNFEINGEIVISAVMGEIVGGVGIRHLLSKESDFSYGVVTEPTNLNVANISVGTGQGVIRLSGDTLYFNPHSSAIFGMAKLIEAMGPAYGTQYPGNWMTFTPCPDLPGFPRINVRKISSGQDYCEIFFDSRIVPGQTDKTLKADLEALVEKVMNWIPGLNAEVRVPINPETSNFPSTPATPQDHSLVKIFTAAHKEVTGTHPYVGAGDRIGLASDASHMKAAGIPSLDYGPGKHPRWPMADECIKVDDVITSAQTLLVALQNLHG